MVSVLELSVWVYWCCYVLSLFCYVFLWLLLKVGNLGLLYFGGGEGGLGVLFTWVLGLL